MEDQLPVFDKVFGYSQEKIISLMLEGNTSSLGAISEENSVRELRGELEKDGIFMDGDRKLLGLGNQAIVARATFRDKEAGGEIYIPEAVTRLEYMEPLMHDIILRPAYKKEYEQQTLTQAKYKTYIVPFAPDIEVDGQPITITADDIKRTIQVLKADGKAEHLWDIQPSAFVYLKGADGKIITYPDTEETDKEFRGKPIAFIRDLNAVDSTTSTVTYKGWLKNNLDMTFEDLPPAPRECVEACKQQYAHTKHLADQLKVAGIKPNVPIPDMGDFTSHNPTGTHASRIKAI